MVEREWGLEINREFRFNSTSRAVKQAGEVNAVSKVVHLSNEAHAQAKVYCKSRGLKMSDWVGSLIIDAISVQEEPKPPEQPQDVSAPRKKQLPRMDDTVQSTDDGVPVYSQPPFWAAPGAEPSEEPSADQTPEETPSPLAADSESLF